MSNNLFYNRNNKPGNFINNGMSNKLNCIDGPVSSANTGATRNESNITINIDGARYEGNKSNIISIIENVMPGLLNGLNLSGGNFDFFNDEEYYDDDSLEEYSQDSGSEMYEEEEEQEEIDELEFMQVKQDLINNLKKEEFGKYLKKNK